MRLVLLGPPGAGKGTQAVLISKKHDIPHVSTGEILREAVSKRTALGVRVEEILKTGKLVPDEIVIELIRGRLGLADAKRGFVLDGFPRTVEQAQALTQLLKELNQPLTKVVEFVVPDEILLDRVKSRAAAGSGRSDDKTEILAKRLQVYWEQTKPVTHYYKTIGTVADIDGLGSVEEVTARLEGVLAATGQQS